MSLNGSLSKKVYRIAFCGQHEFMLTVCVSALLRSCSLRCALESIEWSLKLRTFCVLYFLRLQKSATFSVLWFAARVVCDAAGRTADWEGHWRVVKAARVGGSVCHSARSTAEEVGGAGAWSTQCLEDSKCFSRAALPHALRVTDLRL